MVEGADRGGVRAEVARLQLLSQLRQLRVLTSYVRLLTPHLLCQRRLLGGRVAPRRAQRLVARCDLGAQLGRRLRGRCQCLRRARHALLLAAAAAAAGCGLGGSLDIDDLLHLHPLLHLHLHDLLHLHHLLHLHDLLHDLLHLDHGLLRLLAAARLRPAAPSHAQAAAAAAQAATATPAQGERIDAATAEAHGGKDGLEARGPLAGGRGGAGRGGGGGLQDR